MSQVLNLGSNFRGLETAEFRIFNSRNFAAQNRAKFNRHYFLSIESSPRQKQDASRPHLSYLELRKPRVRISLLQRHLKNCFIRLTKPAQAALSPIFSGRINTLGASNIYSAKNFKYSRLTILINFGFKIGCIPAPGSARAQSALAWFFGHCLLGPAFISDFFCTSWVCFCVLY